jgi:hypothetical protein
MRFGVVAEHVNNPKTTLVSYRIYTVRAARPSVNSMDMDRAFCGQFTPFTRFQIPLARSASPAVELFFGPSRFGGKAIIE